MPSDHQKETPSHQALWGRLALALPVAAFAFGIFALPLGDGEPQIGIGITVALYLLGHELLEHFWPFLKERLLKLGVPSWALKAGHRSNALIAITMALILTALSAWRGDGVTWFAALPAFFQFVVLASILFALLSVGDALRRKFRVS